MYKSLFTLGYTKKLYEDICNKCVYGARCESCRSFSADKVCTNNQVTSFDITTTKDRTYCVFWKPVTPEDFDKKA